MIKYEIFIDERDQQMIEELLAHGYSPNNMIRQAITANYLNLIVGRREHLEIIKEQYE